MVLKGLRYIYNNFSIINILIILFLIIILYFLVNFLKHIKWIILKKDTLKYYNIFHPFGKSLDLDKFIGKIRMQEVSITGSYNVIYLVDKNNMTSFKIMGQHYENMTSINNTLIMNEICLDLSILQYLSLLFFGRINIKNNLKDL